MPNIPLQDTSSVRALTVDELLAIDNICGVCTGHSPSWDGHDMNPPCRGAALDEIVRRARLSDGG